MADATPQIPAKLWSPRQVLLGLFILGQLVFLVLQNLVTLAREFPNQIDPEFKQVTEQLVPKFADHKGHGWVWVDELDDNLSRWVHLTGQAQNWSMFSPGVGNACAFPAVLLRGDEPEENDVQEAAQVFDPSNGFGVTLPGKPPQALLLSRIEPADVHSFFRVGDFRLRYYEGSLLVYALPAKGAQPVEFAKKMNDRVKKLDHGLALAYLQWRLRHWQAEHPDQPAPKQVILLQRSYRIHGPNEQPGWDGPMVIPLLCWRPREGQADADVVLKAYDFATWRFVP